MSTWYVVACNVTGDKVLRNGAKCELESGVHGVPLKVRVSGLSIGGRRVTKWTNLNRCSNFRVVSKRNKTSSGWGFTKEQAQEWAAKLNEMMRDE